MTIPELLQHWAQATPDAPALLAPGLRPLTYARPYEETQALAAQLHSLGVRPDDRVAIVAQNGPELAASFLAVASTAVAADALARELARLRRTYRLRPRPGTLTVLTTMDYESRRDVWLRLADEVRWHEVPVPHATSFLQPHADVLGNTIAEIAHEALEPVR